MTQGGNFAAGWDREHAVLKLLLSCMRQLGEAKRQGACRLNQRLPEQVQEFLVTNRDLLVSITGGASALKRTGGLPPSFVPFMCLDADGFDAARAAVEGRDYIADQVLALDPRLWDDPVRAILFGAAQIASHRAVAGSAGKNEPEITVELASQLRTFVGYELIPAFKSSGTVLPPGQFLEYGSASMQGRRDLLGSDLALVVGVNIRGVPRFRVALLQAKMETTAYRTAVGKNNGRQLDELLSTGMGFYLSYPVPFDHGTFLMTVRSAEDVFEDVHAGRRRPAFTVSTVGNGSAWDLATFLSVAMASADDLTLGRLFPDADAVAQVLSSGRKLPLEVWVVDSTGRLGAFDLVGRLSKVGYQTEVFHMPDDPPDFDADVEPSGGAWRRPGG